MHSVVFKNKENDWKNALPMGNGSFGAMAFYKDGALSLPMNHYEVYYNISDKVLPEEKLRATPDVDNPGEHHRLTRERAERNQPFPGEPFYYYRLDKAKPQSYGVAGFSGSYPATGELRFEFAKSAVGGESRLALNVENAEIELTLKDKLRMNLITAREDVIISHVEAHGKMLRAIYIEYPESRDRDFPEVVFKEIDDKTFAYCVDMSLSKDKRFKFSGIVRLVGAVGKLCGNKISIIKNKKCFYVLTGVFTEWNYSNPLEEGIAKMNENEANIKRLYSAHHAYWKEFFSKSKITLPDKFLERVYYINQYALDCSSGEGGVMKHHACGLNGLWDVRHPNLWGSMWYWDVNIQAAFAGVFSSNRLELGKVFSDGLLSYVELAEKFAKNIHGLSGAAIDYPYSYYYSTWPWCAQYLWSQYEYSQDKEYLRLKAYPLFLKLCEFATQVFEYDSERGKYVIYPDISPEQGPLAHNTVITVASVKYMLKFTLEAAEILGDKNDLLADIKRLYDALPAYPTVTDNYGCRFKDSEEAPANLWIRHPSMLMPVFPTGEIDITSDERLREIAANTITYLEENCEIGVFQVSWLAAASARLGNGQKALRLLYEMGIDHLLRSNGLAAEENERFMNYCLIMRQPLYYPCMMEFTGEMLAAVNEMLMQSNGGVIRLFPAMPNGDPEYDRLLRAGRGLECFSSAYNKYDAWKTVSFERLLARGAFEVSASLRDSKIEYVKIKSLAGGKLKFTSPYSLSELRLTVKGKGKAYNIENNTIEINTTKGGVYEFSLESYKPCLGFDVGEEILSHRAYTKRTVYIGENEETDYQKSLDAFLRSWYLGNMRLENHTVYKFDIGGSDEKDYSVEIPKITYCAERMTIGTMNFVRPENHLFSVKQGYGFNTLDGVNLVNRGRPDELRRDFAEGENAVEFLIEAPRGQYEMLVISGDSDEESITSLEAVGGRKTGGELVARGAYQCKLIPIIHEKDGCMRLKISTKRGYKWKINAILLNMYKQF